MYIVCSSDFSLPHYFRRVDSLKEYYKLVIAYALSSYGSDYVIFILVMLLESWKSFPELNSYCCVGYFIGTTWQIKLITQQ